MLTTIACSVFKVDEKKHSLDTSCFHVNIQNCCDFIYLQTKPKFYNLMSFLHKF